MKKIFVLLILLSMTSCVFLNNNLLDKTIPSGSVIYYSSETKNGIIKHEARFFFEGCEKTIPIGNYYSSLLWIPNNYSFIGMQWRNQMINGGNIFIWGPKKTQVNNLEIQAENFDFYFDNDKLMVVAQHVISLEVIDTVTKESYELEFPSGFEGMFGVTINKTNNRIYAGFQARVFEFSQRDSIMSYNPISQAWDFVTFGREPQISPDGKKIAFTRDDGLYIRDLSSGHETLVLEAQFDSFWTIPYGHPRWSEDNNKIVIHVWEDMETCPTGTKIYLVNLEGKTVVDIGVCGMNPSFKD